MKNILIILLLFFSAGVYAQLSPTYMFKASDRKNLWSKASNVPSWMIDGFRAKILSNGDTIVRAQTGGVFLAEELGIYANGNDMTDTIKARFGLSYVNVILMTSDSSRVFTLNDTLTANFKVLRFDNGCRFTGTGYVDSVEISADINSYIFNTGIRMGRHLRTNLDKFSVKWYGALGDSTADDTQEIQATFNVPLQTAYFPFGSYMTSDSVVLNPLSFLDMSVGKIVATTTNRAGIIIGSPGPTAAILPEFRGKEYIVNIVRATLSNWTDSNSVGVIFRNAIYSEVKVLRADRFTVGAKFIGDMSGSVYLDVYLGRFEDNQIGLYLATVDPGWANQQNFHGGWFRCNSGTNVGKQRWGIKIGSTGYDNNNNNFYGMSFELNSPLGTAIWVHSGSQNRFYGFRAEGGSDTTVFISKHTNQLGNRNNKFEGSYATGFMADSSRNATNEFTTSFDVGKVNSNYTVITEMSGIPEYCSYSGADSSVSITYPAYWWGSSETPLSTRVGPVIMGDYIKIGAGFGLTTETIDVSQIKSFIIKRDVVPGYGGRIRVAYYDSNMVNISNTKSIQSYLSFAWSAVYGAPTPGAGSLTTGVDTDYDINVTVPSTAKFARIIFVSGTAELRIKSYSIVSYSAGKAGTRSILNNKTEYYNTSPTVPSLGSYRVGRIIKNSAPAFGEAYSWVCTASGTHDATSLLAGVTGSITTGTNILVLSSGAGASIRKGYFLQIGANALEVDAVSGDTVYFKTNASTTLSGAAIAFATPQWEVTSIIGGSSGSGGGGGVLISSF